MKKHKHKWTKEEIYKDFVINPSYCETCCIKKPKTLVYKSLKDWLTARLYQKTRN